MTSPTYALQVAIVTRLGEVTAVTDLIGERVYDDVPPEEQRIADTGADYPYVAFGPSDEISEDAECIDGFEITMQLDVWTISVGYDEARHVAHAIRDALHDHEFELDGVGVVYFRHRITRFLREGGLISHAAMTFEAFAEQP